MTGGYYPATGPISTFELVIRPAEGSGTGLNDHHLKKLNIIPNPTSDFIRIDADFQKDVDVEIYDVTGKLIMKDRYNNHHNLEVSSLNPGVYYIKIRESSRTSVGKFVKSE